MSGIKILAMTTDTDATMNALLGMKLEQMGIAHVYCTDHVLHLTAKVCYGDNSKHSADTFGPFYESVKRGQSLVNYIHSSSQATDILKKTQERMLTVEAYREQKVPVVVKQDVVTRWWSTCDMFKRLSHLGPAIKHILQNNLLPQQHVMHDHDWQNFKIISQVLKPLKTYQKFLEAEKYVTAPWVQHSIRQIRQHLQTMSDAAQGDDVGKRMAKVMLDDFISRWGEQETFTGEVNRGGANNR
jgi:hypothetical protein